MNRTIIFLLSLLCSPILAQSQSKAIDTLIDVGGYKLHFSIIKGKGTPVLFEAGGGEDATTWGELLSIVSGITQTTVIAYDRAGFGESTFDTTRHGILNGVKGLETGLRKLGYDKDIILVTHSQGGLYATLYSSRHENRVRGAVLIDATTSCFYEEKRLATTQGMINESNEKNKKSNPGAYYQGADFSNNINYVRTISFPASIPVIDLVADNPPFSDPAENEDWKACHRQFASMSPNRTGIIAIGCGHFIFKNNPPLVVNAIVKMFAATVDKAGAMSLMQRSLDYAMNAANVGRKP